MTQDNRSVSLPRIPEVSSHFFTTSMLRAIHNALEGRTVGGDPYPPMDIYQLDNSIFIELAMVKMDPSHIDVRVENNQLVLSYKHLSKDETSSKEWVHRGIKSSNFQKVIELGDAIDVDAISSSWSDGLLRIELPIREEKRPKSRSIPINTENT